MRTITAHFSNKPIRWLDFIIGGEKLYEGRIYRKKWVGIKPGDFIICSDGVRTVLTRVKEIRFYANFGVAFKDLGSDLIPLPEIKTVEQAQQLYADIYADVTETEINKHGVIALRMELA